MTISIRCESHPLCVLFSETADFKQSADSFFELAVHNPATHEDLVNLDEAKLYTDLIEQVTLWRLPEPSYLHASLGHLLAGYDAGYNACVW